MSSPAFLGLVALVAVAAFAVYGWVRDSQRRQALVAYCRAQGWQYVAEDPALAVRWRGTPFGEGTDQRARNVVTGVTGAAPPRPFVAFDFTYVTQQNDSRGRTSRTTHRFAVVALALPTWLPRVQVVPESLLRRAVEALGVDPGVELESEDFNRRFVVTSRQPKFASDVLTPRTMQGLLAAPPTAWRTEGGDIVSWGEGTVAPVDVLARLAVLRGVVDGIPEFVWHDNGYAPDGQQPAPPPEGSAR